MSPSTTLLPCKGNKPTVLFPTTPLTINLSNACVPFAAGSLPNDIVLVLPDNAVTIELTVELATVS